MDGAELMPRRRALMIVNAGARRGEEALGLVPRFEAAGIDVSIERPERAQDTARLIQARAAEIDLVIVCGGDGTMNAAAEGILRTGLPMGVVPLGTANDLARTLEIVSVDAAAGAIIDGRTEAIDIGEVNHKPFFNVASIGLSADLARDLDKEVKRRWGRFGYAIAAARVLAAGGTFHAEITGESGSVRVETLQVSVGNGRFYGGGAVVRDDASITDGRLDLYSLEHPHVWRLLLLLGSFRKGTHGMWDEVRVESGTQFEVRTRRPRPVNADGELVTTTPARFMIRTGAIRVFVPIASSVSPSQVSAERGLAFGSIE
jgi:YegS/Rv2252/BmrU family lipid kinase